MSEINLPEETSNKVTCMSCNNLLSVTPVYVKSDGTGAVCGRCQIEDADSYFRDERYEAIAQLILFPCKYKENGCSKSFVMHQLKDHELNCTFQNHSCPSSIYTQCDWKGPRDLLLQHYKETHPKLIIENQRFDMNLFDSTESNLLLKFENELFIVEKEVDYSKKSFSFTVDHLKSKKDKVYSYSLSLENTDQQVYECNGKTIDLKEKVLNSMVMKIVLRSGLPQLKELNENTASVNWKLLSELECPVCYEYMLRKIFLCSNGHSVCSNCKPKLNGVCPTCRENIGETHNFALEKLTNHILYPCKFNKFGCMVSCKSREIANHADNCDFKQFECPLKTEKHCPWTGLISEIVVHVEISHTDMLIKNTSIGIPFNQFVQLSSSYLIIFNKEVFKLYFDVDKVSYKWGMKNFGKPSNQFTFHIDISDPSRNMKYLSVTGPVVSFGMSYPTSNIEIPQTLVNKLNRKLVYFVKITGN